MKTKLWKMTAALLALVLLGASLTGCGKKIDGTKTALTVNGENASLGLLSFNSHLTAAAYANFYLNYVGSLNYFDQIGDEATGETVGRQTVTNTAEALAKAIVVSQHAAEYGVSLTDEQKAKIDAAAQAYIEKNDSKVLAKVGASKEDVVRAMELETLYAYMKAPLAEDVDLEVTDEESQQSQVTYISINLTTEDDVTVSEGDGEAEETKEAIETLVAEQNKVIREVATGLLEKIKGSEDPATADMDALAKEVSEDYTAVTVYFPTYDPDSTVLDKNVMETAKTLDDGEVSDKIVESADGKKLFIVRLDRLYDEEATNNKKDSILKERKQTHFNEVIDAWFEEADVTYNKDVMKAIELTDTEPFMFSDSLGAAGAAADGQ